MEKKEVEEEEEKGREKNREERVTEGEKKEGQQERKRERGTGLFINCSWITQHFMSFLYATTHVL